MAKKKATPKPTIEKKRGGPKPESALVAAIQAHAGNLSRAAESLGIARWSLRDRISKSPGLQQVVADARAELVDTAESQLLSKIKQGDTIAIIFALKTQGKDRGYVERQETTGADGQPVTYRLILDGQDDQ